jgi:hypothetical protein
VGGGYQKRKSSAQFPRRAHDTYWKQVSADHHSSHLAQPLSNKPASRIDFAEKLHEEAQRRGREMTVTTRSKGAKTKVQTKGQTKVKSVGKNKPKIKQKIKQKNKPKTKAKSAQRKRRGEGAQAYSWEAMALKARKALKELDMVLTQVIVAANKVCSYDVRERVVLKYSLS